MRFHSITAAGAALLAGLAFGAPAAQAATATTNFTVTLTVLNQCVVAATPMAFGSLALVGGTGGQATNVLTVTCTAGTPFTIGLNQGTAPTATIATRLMRGPVPVTTSTVAYSLYQDAARTILWGNTTETQVNGGTATGLPQNFTVYGQILGGQGVAPAGAYTDTVTVTVTYP